MKHQAVAAPSQAFLSLAIGISQLVNDLGMGPEDVTKYLDPRRLVDAKGPQWLRCNDSPWAPVPLPALLVHPAVGLDVTASSMASTAPRGNQMRQVIITDHGPWL